MMWKLRGEGDGGHYWTDCSHRVLEVAKESPPCMRSLCGVHTLARRPPVAPTNCSIQSCAGDGRRPLIGYQRRLGNFPTASAC
ncbi:hypothetical protein AMECASPLE_011057 [Ameca splendens]|uniref:Uncharacterized protein n=1 Tax=Ameca splendens TaxID=208324 RepID=A0ABV0ZWV4_9TELE